MLATSAPPLLNWTPCRNAARAGMANWVTLASSRVAVDEAIASLSQRLSAPVR